MINDLEHTWNIVNPIYYHFYRFETFYDISIHLTINEFTINKFRKYEY